MASILPRKRFQSDNLVIFVTTGVTILSAYFSGAVTVLLPTIQKSLKISDANLVWPVSLYSLVLACFLPLAGRLCDVYGRRTCFLIGTLHFALSSFAFAFSPNLAGASIFSALMGIAPALYLPAATGIIGFKFVGRKKNVAFCFLGAGQPLGYIFGNFLAAFFAKRSWRVAFWLQAGLAAFFLVTGFFSLPPNQQVAERDRSIDWIGAGLATSGLVLLNFALTDSQSAPQGWATPYIISFLPVSLLLLVGFIFWERRLERNNRVPLIALSLFSRPFFAAILSVAFFAWLAFNTVQYWLNLYVQNILHYTPIQTALAFLPLVISGSLLNVLPGFLMSRIRGQWLIMAGLVLALPSAVMFSQVETSLPYWAMLFPILALLPGPDLAYTVASVQISLSVDPRLQSMAGAMFNVATRLGTAIGLSLSSSIANGVTAKAQDLTPELALLKGYKAAGWLGAGSTAASMVIAAFFCRNMGIVGQTSNEESSRNEAELDARQ